MYRTVKIARVVVQLILLTAITWSLMAAPGVVATACRDTLAAWQLIPLSMLGSMLVVGVWLTVTFLLGRVYCSTVCPIGTLQDVASRASRIVKRHRRYSFKPAPPLMLRIALIAVLVMAMLFGSLAATWAMMPILQLSPYDSYATMVNALGPTVAGWLGYVDATPVSLRIGISAGINFVFIIAMGCLKGRDVCNTLCPVGGLLGAVNTLALYRFDINTDCCTHCRRCEDVCKASCLDSDKGTVDHSRCVACFNCVAACDDDAIHYTRRRHRLSLPMMQRVDKQRPALSHELEQPLTPTGNHPHT